MYLSRGLVMDIGGVLSHAAIIARELGVPCVANTKIGTRILHTGTSSRSMAPLARSTSCNGPGASRRHDCTDHMSGGDS